MLFFAHFGMFFRHPWWEGSHYYAKSIFPRGLLFLFSYFWRRRRRNKMGTIRKQRVNRRRLRRRMAVWFP